MGTVKSGKILHVLFAVMALIMVTLGCRAQTYASNSDSSFILQDEPRAHGDLTFMKKDSISGAALSGAQFLLSGTSDYGNDIVKTAGSDAYGKVLISNIEKGTYDLEETTAPDGYIPAQSAWKAVVNEDGLVALYAADGVTELSKDNGVYQVPNEPYHSVTFIKTSTYGTNNTLQGAEFELLGASDYGNNVDKTAVSDSDGYVSFTGLEPGTYQLKETKAPADHELDTKYYRVEVKADGTFTIDGLKKTKLSGSDAEVYDFKDIKTKGMVRVDKIWEDTLTDAERPDPSQVVIFLSTRKPSKDSRGYTVTYNSNGGTFTDGRTENSVVYSPAGTVVDGTYSVPTKDAMEFVGWYTDKNCTMEFPVKAGAPEYAVSADITVYAKYRYQAAMMLPGKQFNAKIKQIAGNSSATYNTSDSTIKSISWSNTEPDAQYKTDAYRVDVNSGLYTVPVYFYPGSDGAYYLWSPASTVYMNKDSSYMFNNCYGLTSLDVSKFDTGNVTNMENMFHGCSNLTSLDVSNFDTGNVTNMGNMFYDCSKLTSLDVSGFDTSDVTDMIDMFFGCSALTSLDVSKFDTGNVTDMRSMFRYCYSLTSLDVSHFDTGNVTNMSYMFSGCSGLTSLDVSHFDTGNVTNMGYMFEGCSKLTSLDVSKFDTGNVASMDKMFQNCFGLTSLDVSKFNTGKVTNMSGMFYCCSSLTSLDVSGFDTANATNMGSMFSGCSSLTTIYAGLGWNTDKVTSSSFMFYNDSNLIGGAGTSYDSGHTDKAYARIDGGTDNPGYFTGKNTTVAPSADAMLLPGQQFNAKIKQIAGHSSATYQTSDSTIKSISWSSTEPDAQYQTDAYRVDVNNSKYNQPVYFYPGSDGAYYLWSPASKVYMNKNSSYMFYNCRGLTSLDVSKFNTSNVTNMASMFQYCSNLTSLDVSHFDMSNVTSMHAMFSGCSGLTSLDVSKFDTGNVTDMGYMFEGCSKLTSLDVSGFDTGNVTNMGGMFQYCSKLTSLDVSGFDTGNVTYMNYMFSGCSKLTSLDVSGFDTGNVTNMNTMFNNCRGLTSLDVSKFDTSNVTNMSGMFQYCSSLTTIYAGQNWKADKVTSSSSMFYNDSNLVGGLGTVFDSSHTDKTYAHVDGGTDDPGYFTSTTAYTIRYDTNGGTGTMKNQTVVPTEKPDTLRTNKYTKDGYTFVYWNTAADGSGTTLEASHTANGLEHYTVHGIVTLYAIWGAPRTITYNANGGAGDDIIQDVTENLEWTVQGNSFTRDGYAFVGWNTAKDGTGDPYEVGATQRYSKTEDMTLYAQWGPQHTVTYKANGGTGDDVTQTVYEKISWTVNGNDTMKFTAPDGLNFAGWNTAADGSGTAYKAGASQIYDQTGDLTLYAQWKDKIFSVDLNNGQWVDSGTTVDGNTVYKSDSGSYKIPNGKSVATITVTGYTTFTVYIRSYAESNYDYTEAFDADITAARSKGKYSTKGKSSSSAYTACTYTLDGGTHTIQILYSKDGSGDSNDDRGYFYIPANQ